MSTAFDCWAPSLPAWNAELFVRIRRDQMRRDQLRVRLTMALGVDADHGAALAEVERRRQIFESVRLSRARVAPEPPDIAALQSVIDDVVGGRCWW